MDSGLVDSVFELDDGWLVGLIGFDGRVVVDWWNAGRVVATGAAVDGCEIFLVALIGLERTGAHSEPVEHISQNASIVQVNTDLSIVLSDGGRRKALGVHDRLHLKTEFRLGRL